MPPTFTAEVIDITISFQSLDAGVKKVMQNFVCVYIRMFVLGLLRGNFPPNNGTGRRNIATGNEAAGTIWREEMCVWEQESGKVDCAGRLKNKRELESGLCWKTEKQKRVGRRTVLGNWKTKRVERWTLLGNGRRKENGKVGGDEKLKEKKKENGEVDGSGKLENKGRPNVADNFGVKVSKELDISAASVTSSSNSFLPNFVGGNFSDGS